MAEILFAEKGTDFCTPVSNRFLSTFLPQASGSSVKVYLYVYYQFYNQVKGLTLAHVAEALGMMEDDVVEALTYWQSKGQVTFERTGSACRIDFPICCSFSGGPDGTRRCRKEDKEVRPIETKVVRMEQAPVYSAEELLLYKKNDQVKSLFNAASEFVGSPASSAILSTTYSFYDYYRIPIDVIKYLFQYCQENGNRTLRYVEKIVQDFSDNGINTVEAAEAHLTRFRRFSPILKAMKITYAPSDAQITYMTRWLDEMKMPQELIEEAARRTLEKTGKASFAYAEAILKNWSAQGFTTLEAVTAGDVAFRPSSTGTGFFNIDPTGTDYDAIAKASQKKFFEALED